MHLLVSIKHEETRQLPQMPPSQVATSFHGSMAQFISLSRSMLRPSGEVHHFAAGRVHISLQALRSEYPISCISYQVLRSKQAGTFSAKVSLSNLTAIRLEAVSILTTSKWCLVLCLKLHQLVRSTIALRCLLNTLSASAPRKELLPR